jgi:hypothetical protein
VVGAGRLLLVLTLFVLIERLTHSSRIAGVAAALYMANPDYLFFTAEYAYESIALPLSIVVLLAIWRRDQSSARWVRHAWTTVAVLVTLSVVVTHHLTSYALVASLWGMVILSRSRMLRARPAPWDLAVIATLAVAAWFAVFARDTWVYLAFPVGGAVLGLFNLLTLHQAPRQVFDPASAFGSTPVWQELIVFGSIVLIVIGLPFGLVRLWRTSRHQTIALLLGGAAALYIPIQALRLAPASWETANRASEFLFLGVAFVLSVALLGRKWRSRGSSWVLHTGLPLYVSVIFMAGVVVSWRPDLRLPRAYNTQVAGRDVPPEGVAVAEFTRQRLGMNNSMPTDESNAMLLAAYGHQAPWLGQSNGIRRMLGAPSVDSGAVAALTFVGAQYVVLDRRVQSADHLLGVYPLPRSQAPDPRELIDPAAFAKFDFEPNVNRVADSGNIVVYDVGKLSGVK